MANERLLVTSTDSATGDELVEVELKPAAGQIRSGRNLLTGFAGWVAASGLLAVSPG